MVVSEEAETAVKPVPRWSLHPLGRLLVRLAMPPYLAISIIAVIVGVGTGYGAVLFIASLGWIQHVAGGLRQDYGLVGMFLSLTVGGALGAPLIVYVASEARGHGVPEVMMAIAVQGGRIRPRVVIVKAIASALTIGTGGSAGREGPIVQIGSALGSTLGQWLAFSEERIKILVAAGAAGGIAATFNAPIAGVIFALEVVLGEFSMGYFGVVVIASVSASIVSRAYLGAAPAFHVPAYGLNSIGEIPLYVLIGIVSAFVAVFFILILYKAEDLFEAWKAPEVIKPVIGMILTGAVAVFYPQVLGPGLHFIGEAIAVNMQMGLMLLAPLAIAKLVATSFTLGAGNSGGVFAPSLFAGAALGGSLGILFKQWFPGMEINPGAYALVGMAATFAGAARAPITAILIVFEMSNDYRLILPLMLATVISTAIAHYLQPESIYTFKLARRGIVVRHGRDIDVMESVTVGEAMDSHPVTVREDMPLSRLGRMFIKAHGHGFPVVSSHGNLVGIISLGDYQKASERSKDLESLTVGDIMTRDLIVTYPDESLWQALRKLGLRDVSRLPVVSRQNPEELLGVIRRRDIIHAYNLAIARRSELAQRMQELRLGEEDTEYIKMELPAEAWAVGKQVQEVPLPEDCVLVSIRRGRRVVVPHGDTILQPGDRITIFSTRECKPRVLNILALGKDIPKEVEHA